MKTVVQQLQAWLLPLLKLLPVGVLSRLARLTSPSYRVGAAAALLNDDGELLLVRHTYRYGWGLPGGSLARGENPAGAIARELNEELGLDLLVVDEPHWFMNLHWRRVETLFVINVDGQVPSAVSPEIAEVRWFCLDELPELERYLETVLERVLARSVISQGEVQLPPGRGRKRLKDTETRWFGPDTP